jgi:transketolase
MRDIFFDEFKEMMRNDSSLFFLTGDTGFHLVESIFEEFPLRSLNVGVAEQNMIGIASGLVNIGFVPVCYAITNFLIERCFEQIRNDICLHEYKVILVGTSTGYDNGPLGATHHKLDDIAAIKALPNINIYSPSGNQSLSITTKEVFSNSHASFIRISKHGIDEKTKVESPNHYICEINLPTLVISHGKMVGNALDAYDQLPMFSIFAMDRIKPLDDALLASLFLKFKTIIIIEDNFRSGLYNSLCQWAVEQRACHTNIFSISPNESYDEVMGDSNFLEESHGLSVTKINERIINIINNQKDFLYEKN